MPDDDPVTMATRSSKRWLMLLPSRVRDPPAGIGGLLLHDNGSQRPPAPDGKVEPPYSRAVQYELDRSGPRETWTARQVWEHRIDTPVGPVYSATRPCPDRAPLRVGPGACGTIRP